MTHSFGNVSVKGVGGDGVSVQNRNGAIALDDVAVQRVDSHSVEEQHHRLAEALAEMDSQAAEILVLKYVHSYKDAESGSKLKAVSGEYVESLLVNQGRSTLDKLARTLGIRLGGPVINKTGLAGAYEYAIEVNPPPSPQINPKS